MTAISFSQKLPNLNKHFSKVVILCLLLTLVSCNFTAPDDEEENGSNVNNETEIALGVEQTLLAQESSNANATIAAQQATIQAQSILATSQAMQPPEQPPAEPPVEPPPPVVQETQPPVVNPQPNPTAQSAQSPPAGDFDQWMKSAQILLFEDVVADPRKSRYVKDTLDSMDLRYKNDGNAIGWLKNDLLAGSPAGKPWDLVIIAIEERGNVSGEYFEYLRDVLKNGSSVILEAWHLDAISEGKVSPILADCGVQVYPYFPKTMSLVDVIMYPYPAASAHPIMTDPNGGLSFTKSLNTWLWTGDLGSLMAYTGRGDAVFLLGTSPQDDVKDAGLAVCMGGQLTLQTFSSHSFSYRTIYPLWENYITNALRVRFAAGN